MFRPDDLSLEPGGREEQGLLWETGASLLDRLPAADFPLVTVRLSLPVADGSDRRSDALRVEDALCERLGATEVLLPVSAVRDLYEVGGVAERDLLAIVRAPHGIGDPWEVTRVLQASADVAWYLAVIDLGVERVWGELLDGETGKVASTATGVGPLLSGGYRVSLEAMAREPGGRDRLVAAALDGVRAVLDDLGDRCGAAPGSIEQVVVAGDRRLISMLLGSGAGLVDREVSAPRSGGTVELAVDTTALGRYVAAGAPVRALPGAGGCIGGDVVGGLLASGIANAGQTSLYVDLGPGGEVVVGNREWLLAGASEIRGVFEGEGLRHGMPPVGGAISRVSIDPRSGVAEVLTVDGSLPRGLCGSGLIEAVGQLADRRLVREDGTFDASSDSPRLRVAGGEREYVLVTAGSSATGNDIVLLESEVAGFVQAKASVFAAMTSLLQAASLGWGDLQRVVVAGAVGPTLNLAAAVAVGLFPRLEAGRFEYLGNGSLLGARAVGTSRRMGSRSEQVASFMQVLDFAADQSCQREYQNALLLRAVDAA